MIRMLCFGALLALGVCGASADEYWFAYEASDGFPEEEGWTRGTSAGGATRFLDQGDLVIDSRASIEISDFYRMDLAGHLDPGPGETFLARWRVLIEESNGTLGDLIVDIRSDARWAALFHMSENALGNLFEPGLSVPFKPGVYHEFDLRSSDMRTYELRIDGKLMTTGRFRQGLFQSDVTWGDGIQGSSSLSRWDYFRFGVVPEPSSALLVSLGFMIRRDQR